MECNQIQFTQLLSFFNLVSFKTLTPLHLFDNYSYYLLSKFRLFSVDWLFLGTSDSIEDKEWWPQQRKDGKRLNIGLDNQLDRWSSKLLSNFLSILGFLITKKLLKTYFWLGKSQMYLKMLLLCPWLLFQINFGSHGLCRFGWHWTSCMGQTTSIGWLTQLSVYKK